MERFVQEFRPSDAQFSELVAERRQEVEALQQREAEQIKQLNAHGAQRMKSFEATIGTQNAGILKKIEKEDAAEEKRVKAQIDAARAAHASAELPVAAPKEHPGFVYSNLAAPQTSGWITPYYATLHGSDGSVYWQGYNPGTFDLWDTATGSGSGIFGTGSASFTVYLDWWFNFRPDSTHFYGHNIYIPFYGFYIIYSDDGSWDSKEAAAKIDLTARGYQYGWKPQASNNLFNIDSQNINVNGRWDGWRTMYYGDLLAGGGTAYLLVSASFYVYARGGGSHSELNFSDGAANYVGVPWVYFS